MQELVVLGLIPGTNIYIPFSFWLLLATLILVQLFWGKRLKKIIYTFVAYRRKTLIDSFLKKQTVN
ncbi:hypothetical protein KDA06_00300 [Candidatus Saccharibacteria bacterium]|nr:hypothetical protein [Candidatus Saccharibacteria bacterium]HPR09155.1 hypothetical protein [Candidatus Saccharibacteria bacterium]